MRNGDDRCKDYGTEEMLQPDDHPLNFLFIDSGMNG